MRQPSEKGLQEKDNSANADADESGPLKKDDHKEKKNSGEVDEERLLEKGKKKKNPGGIDELVSYYDYHEDANTYL